jgi:hypothetical protein
MATSICSLFCRVVSRPRKNTRADVLIRSPVCSAMLATLSLVVMVDVVCLLLLLRLQETLLTSILLHAVPILTLQCECQPSCPILLFLCRSCLVRSLVACRVCCLLALLFLVEIGGGELAVFLSTLFLLASTEEGDTARAWRETSLWKRGAATADAWTVVRTVRACVPPSDFLRRSLATRLPVREYQTFEAHVPAEYTVRLYAAPPKRAWRTAKNLSTGATRVESCERGFEWDTSSGDRVLSRIGFTTDQSVRPQIHMRPPFLIVLVYLSLLYYPSRHCRHTILIGLTHCEHRFLIIAQNFVHLPRRSSEVCPVAALTYDRVFLPSLLSDHHGPII